VSVQDEARLRSRLGTLLGEISPAPAPVGSVIRRGRRISRRQQAAAAGGIAVVAAAAVLGPAVLRSELAAGSAAPGPAPHYSVSVSPPGNAARRGVIATGSVNGWHWQATLSGTGNSVGARLGQDFPRLAIGTPYLADDLALLESTSDGASRYAYVGPVAAPVRYLTVSLADGQQLILRPQPWAGHRYVAMVLPAALRVRKAVAYGRAGMLGYAVPFYFGADASFQTWLRPGQAGSARATALIGSGSSQWSATAYVGPWGLCVTVYDPGGIGPGGFCQAVSQVSFGLVTGQFGGVADNVEVGLARHDVAYLMITRSDGSVVRVKVAYVAGYPYGLAAVLRPAHGGFASWVAYNAHGRRLGSGKGDPVRLR